MYLNKELKENKDIIDVAWVSIEDKDKWDNFTLPILDLYIKSLR
ncbi:hypothetical protein [Rossellomorea aquimaris]|nr:hypothetical protein [Rossellomorea aquimaris]